jgi:serine kinase of HPr protein (carbohydrate metabolism regulator)
MINPRLSSEMLHASCVAIEGLAVLIGGRSGSGKSDLAIRLIDRGAQLVSDDYTLVRKEKDQLVATAPANISGKIELRGVGLLSFSPVQDVPVRLYVDIDLLPTRLPEPGSTRLIAGTRLPMIGLAALEASAPIKVEAALRLIGQPSD